MIKIFLALVSVFAVLAISMFVKMLMMPVRHVRGFFARKAVSA